METKKHLKKSEERILHSFTIRHEEELLSFLLRRFQGMSRNKVKPFLIHNQVLVNGIVIRQFDYHLAKDDELQILVHGQKAHDKTKTKLEIIYEDEEFLVINKPSGLLSIATDNERENTAYRLANEYVSQESKKNRIFICHRIDKETSGVLMFVKNEKTRNALQSKWNSLVTKRIYKAIVEGTPKPLSGRIVSYLLETKTNLMYSAHEKGNGQKAITNYKTLKSNGTYSLVELNLETGRKNQIRVHMKDLGTPVVGDDKYHSSSDPLKRLGLHHETLEFIHPFTKKRFCFKTKMPSSFSRLFDK